MTSSSAVGRPDSAVPWRWPVDLARYDAAPLLRPAEQDAIIELGADNLRRFTARAKGRGNVINKQTCHIHVTVGDGK